jgi:chaperonin GroEL
METSDTEETYVELVDGLQVDCGLTSQHFVTNTEKITCELENPYVLIVSSEIPNVRKIQGVLEHVIKKGRALLIVAPVSQQVKSALLMNKVKGTIKVNVIDLPGFGPTKADATEDLAILTGATVINEELGDDLDMITPEYLGEAEYALTDASNTIITLGDMTVAVEERIDSVVKKMAEEKNDFIKKKLEARLAMLSGAVGIVRVGADSKVELKEKKDRAEDAIYATKAALKEGIVAGGGAALLWASKKIKPTRVGEEILLEAIKAPFYTILDNAGITDVTCDGGEGCGIDVISGKCVDMLKAGIVDPVLVTKSALKNACSVVSTIISADCVISNARADEGDQ